MNATLNGQELPNTPVKGTGNEFTPNGWLVKDGAVVTCSICGAPITKDMLDEYAISIETLDSFDELTCPDHDEE